MEKLIKRYFTKDLEPGGDVFDLFDWKKVDIEIKNETTGEIIFKQNGCEFPKHYSQTACEIIASKYFYRAVPEYSLRQVADRMASFWGNQLMKEGLIETSEEYTIFKDEIIYTLLNQMWAPNSPQWFNTGLMRYGIHGDADNLYYYDPERGEVVKSPDRYTRTQASACFILDIKDQLIGPGSITDHYVNETKLFKGGSGVGTNFSTIRAEGEPLSSGGTSSGLMSYLEGLDRNAGAIKSGGTTRRAAKMVIVDIDHPEIVDFIRWKAHEEKKAKALIEAGYDGSIGGEAYNTVSGQNSNNSVRLSRDFMNALDEPEATIKLKGRVDDCVDKEIKVSELWDEIAQAAWECGDPAVQFDDRYNEWNTCAASGRINATNPCSEFAFLDNSACNLASINVYKFFRQYRYTHHFDIEGYKHLIGLIQLVLEASIEGGQFPTPEVAENSYKFRPTGLGLTNLASLFLDMCIPYDSNEARCTAALLSSLMTGWSYVVSAGIAKRIGPFEKWEENKESMKEVIQKHAEESRRMSLACGPLSDLWVEQRRAWALAETAVDYGFRNAQVSVMAPTGTISFAMDCGSTGIEPFYSHQLFKKCADGSFMTIKNPLAEKYIEIFYKDPLYDEDGYYDEDDYTEEYDTINVYFEKYGTFKNCPILDDEDRAVLATAMEISPEAHVEMMAAIQPFISGSISKTVNLPNDATPEDIKDIYKYAYDLGCKSIAIYRDGSKGIQPLADKKEEEDNSFKLTVNPDIEEPIYKQYTRPKKPEGIRNSRTHSAKLGDVELYITVGYYPDGKMAELFVSTDRDGTVVKGLLTCLSKAISHLLQNHVEPEEISKMLRGQKFEPSGPVSRHPNIKFADSIADLISKVIDIECGDYSRCQIKSETVYLDGVPSPDRPAEIKVNDVMSAVMGSLQKAVEKVRVYGERCPECGSEHLIKSGTCKTCEVCGATTGCA